MSLNHGGMVNDVRAALATHGIEPQCLILEVTESLLLEESAQVENTVRDLKGPCAGGGQSRQRAGILGHRAIPGHLT